MNAYGRDPNVFQELCDSRHRRLSKFRETYPDLDFVLGAALDAGGLITSSMSLLCDMTRTETHRWMMWQTLFEYQKQSLLLIASANIDGGLALLRLASELSRDVAIIQDYEERLDLWLTRRDPTRQREYHRLFRFNDAVPSGAMARKVYNFCSEYGVHGHATDTMHLERVGTASPPDRDELVLLKVSDFGMLTALQFWLGAFGPLHLLCLETFDAKHHQTIAEPYRFFVQMAEAISPVLIAITVRLKELARSRPN